MRLPPLSILQVPYAHEVFKVPYVILADKAFALNEYTMKPFPGDLERDFEERILNYRLSRARTFNLANFRTRSKKQLMNQWKCIKLNTKKELSSRSNRFETSKTGGGQKPPAPSPDTMDVAEMIPQEFEDDFNEFDCDGVEDITNIIILGANDIPKENKANNDKDYMTKAKENHVKPNNKNPLKTPKTPMRTTPLHAERIATDKVRHKNNILSNTNKQNRNRCDTGRRMRMIE
ncbi:unnamed protein product [Pieris brassicae]|uniref:DDE Tnp4 domain-containing protein n=1 Tax=Pieris brassicae TaxID=7116 RepID=A0A9P0TL29_PIEBR|nr:unnamed protein product [Pieris brassicae]